QTAMPHSGASDRRYELYSATVNARLGNADLVAISGYSVHAKDSSIDESPSYGEFLGTLPPFSGADGSLLTDVNRTSKFSQELRLSMPLTAKMAWTAGAFYTHEYTPYEQQIQAADYSTGAGRGTALFLDWWNGYTEYAVFTDLTVKFTPRFDVQFGGR